MTEIQKKRSIAALKANETRKLAKLSPRAYKARKAIKEEYAEKIAAIENETTIHSMKVSCNNSVNTNSETVYEIYTRNKGRFVFLGKTTKNPLS